MRSSWNMWEPTWVSRSRCWLLTGERLGHVCMSPDDARVIKEVCMWLPNFVRSPGLDPGRHEEFRNGPEVKIYIWEVLFWSPKGFRVLSVTYRDHQEGPGGSTKWDHRPRRAAWATCGRGPAPGGLVRPPTRAQDA